MSDIEKKVVDSLVKVTGAGEVRSNLDVDLFQESILDSLGFVELIVELSDTFSISIPPMEVERESWSTPRKIIAFVAARIHSQGTSKSL